MRHYTLTIRHPPSTRHSHTLLLLLHVWTDDPIRVSQLGREQADRERGPSSGWMGAMDPQTESGCAAERTIDTLGQIETLKLIKVFQLACLISAYKSN